jgi:hypothetical protein
MFQTAFINLNDALRYVSRDNVDFNHVKSLLRAALQEVRSDPNQPTGLKRRASSAINQALDYAYSRSNPTMGPPSMMTTPPISLQQSKSMPFGYIMESQLGPPVPGVPQIQPFSQAYREKEGLKQLLRVAINIVRAGL